VVDVDDQDGGLVVAHAIEDAPVADPDAEY
jgi:hypothetical protein